MDEVKDHKDTSKISGGGADAKKNNSNSLEILEESEKNDKSNFKDESKINHPIDTSLNNNNIVITDNNNLIEEREEMNHHHNDHENSNSHVNLDLKNSHHNQSNVLESSLHKEKEKSYIKEESYRDKDNINEEVDIEEL